jgi:hypothetical protein
MVDGVTATYIFNFSTRWKCAVSNTLRLLNPGGTVQEPIELEEVFTLI